MKSSEIKLQERTESDGSITITASYLTAASLTIAAEAINCEGETEARLRASGALVGLLLDREYSEIRQAANELSLRLRAKSRGAIVPAEDIGRLIDRILTATEGGRSTPEAMREKDD